MNTEVDRKGPDGHPIDAVGRSYCDHADMLKLVLPDGFWNANPDCPNGRLGTHKTIQQGLPTGPDGFTIDKHQRSYCKHIDDLRLVSKEGYWVANSDCPNGQDFRTPVLQPNTDLVTEAKIRLAQPQPKPNPIAEAEAKIAAATETEKAQMSGYKTDTGKPDMSLLPFDALWEAAKVLTRGLKKYPRENWRKVPGGKDRYVAASMRHLAAIQLGEVYDLDTGDLHSGHLLCCTLFLCALDVMAGRTKEPRPPGAREGVIDGTRETKTVGK